MNSQHIGRFAAAFLFALTGLLTVARRADADEGDPPSRVARISFLNGSVSFQPGGSVDWGNATLNRPMTIGDRLWTDADARAELEAGAATIHLGERTALSFLNLDDRTIQMRLAEGHISFRVRVLTGNEVYELDAPNLAFTVSQAGEFRVDVNENGDVTSIIVFHGAGEVTAAGQTYKVQEGERGEFRGTDQVEYVSGQAPAPDDLDRWAADREGREDNSASARYVSRDVPGHEDLDDNGRWNDEPGYGPVWYPTVVAPGWAPYSVGHWVWISPWGWTWVDAASWGFAPFHYGRWAFIGGSWGWCPGPFFARPVFGPAFVGFIGGRHFGFGFGSPVAWFPLGFREPFFPGFRGSAAFVTRINVSNTIFRDPRVLREGNGRGFNFVHAHNANAVTAVSQRTFANGEAVGRASMHVTPEMLRNSEVSNRAEVSPNRQSTLGASARGRVSTPPSAVQNRGVLTRSNPAQGAQSGTRNANTAGGLRSSSSERSIVHENGANSSRPPVRAEHMTRTDRPPWTGNSASASSGARTQGNFGRGSNESSRGGSSASPRPMDRSMNSGRSSDSPRYSAPSRTYSAPSRTYSAPSRTYSAPSRTYSAPSRTYSAPSRSYPAPSRSSSPPRSSSGGSSHGSSGSSSRGGSSHGSHR